MRHVHAHTYFAAKDYKHYVHCVHVDMQRLDACVREKTRGTHTNTHCTRYM